MDTFLLMAFAPSVTLVLALVHSFVSPPHVISKRSIVLVIACLMAGIVAAGLIGPGTPLLFFMSCIFGSIPALLIGGVITILCRRTLHRFFAAIVGFSIVLYISAFATAMVEMVSLQPYCNSLIDNLEAFKSKYGDYPASLIELAGGLHFKPLKALLRGDDRACGYRVTWDHRYEFVIGMGGIGEQWIYQSKVQQWEYRK